MTSSLYCLVLISYGATTESDPTFPPRSLELVINLSHNGLMFWNAVFRRIDWLKDRHMYVTSKELSNLKPPSWMGRTGKSAWLLE